MDDRFNQMNKILADLNESKALLAKTNATKKLNTTIGGIVKHHSFIGNDYLLDDVYHSDPPIVRNTNRNELNELKADFEIAQKENFILKK